MRDALAACAGLVVLDLGEGMAGSMPGQILADNGADVLKVEPPWGDRTRSDPGFRMWNRGKRSVVIDLRDEAGQAQLASLASRADVVIESWRPGVAERLGAGYDRLRSLNPRLVYCSISAWGPAADQPGWELDPDGRYYEGHVAAAAGHMVGLAHLSGRAPGQDRAAPLFTVAPVASYGAAMMGLQGILSAILERDRSGQGDRVSTSLLQGMVAFLMRQELARVDDDGAPVAGISEVVQAGIELCFMTAECADGRFLQMCARQDRHFMNWLAACELDDLAADPRFAGGPMRIPTIEDLRQLEAALRVSMKRKTADEWMRVFTQDYDIGADPFLTPHEFLQHPQMILNDRVVEIEDPEVGPCRQLGPLALFAATPSTIGAPAPALGQHTAEVLEATTIDDPTIGAPIPAAGAPAAASASPVAATANRRPPLDGITVVELAYFIAGPLAGALLAELGARVIKIEPLDGDPYRRTGLQATKFLHGKESIAVDVKHPDGLAAVHDLIAGADLFIHNFRPGVPERLGLDPATLHAINPNLVHIAASSYGSKGPQAGRTAFHSTPNALVGSGILQAGLGNPPVDDSYPDPGSAIGVATAALLGLHARRVNGIGQAIETTMLATTGYIMSPWLVEFEGMVVQPTPDGGQHGPGALYRLYPTTAGWVFVGAMQESEWHAVARALDRPEWLDDPRFKGPEARRAHDAELTAEVAATLAKETAGTWVARCAPEGAPVVAATELTEEQWLIKEGLVLPETHHEFGPHWRPPVKVSFDRSGNRLVGPTGIGEHTRALLRQLGRSEADIDRMFADHVVAAPGAPASDTAAGAG